MVVYGYAKGLQRNAIRAYAQEHGLKVNRWCDQTMWWGRRQNAGDVIIAGTLERHADNHKVITKVSWLELSLVDRPSNPTSTFSIYKVGNPNASRDVRNLPSATGKSIEEMWSDLHEAKMKIDSMPDGDKKFDAMAEHQRAVEKTLAHQFRLHNEARLKAKYPDPVRHIS